MNLNVNCVVVAVNIKDEKIKFRMMELGLVQESVVRVYKKSLMKKTLLVIFNSIMFTMKQNIAENIEVRYA